MTIIFEGVFSLQVKFSSATLCGNNDITYLEIQRHKEREGERHRETEKKNMSN